MIFAFWFEDSGSWKQEIFKRLDALAEKLGVAAGHLWQVLVRQAYAEAVTTIIALLLGMLLTAITLRVWKWSLRKVNDDACPDDDAYIWPSLVLSGASIILLGYGIVGLFSLPTQLMNPEFYALTKILETLR